ncbi:MAG: tetratricopeptide repeat protein [Pyrinomonadaceae bacterium]
MPDYFISQEKAESGLLDCAAYIGERIKSSDGHAEAMKAIIPRYLSRGELDLAAELANAVDDPYSRDRLLIAVAEKCADADDDEYALQLADAVEDTGMQAEVLERVALVMAAKGRTEMAAEVAATMAHPDFVYAGIAVNQAAAGDRSTSDATLDGIEFPAARVTALMQIAGWQLKEERNDDAVSSLERAVISADEIEHDEEKIRALTDIGNSFIEAKRNDKAVETFDKARSLAEALDNVHRDNFLARCAIGFLHAGSDELCDRTLDLVTDKTQMASALVAVARDHWKKEEKDDAVDTLDEAYEILKSQRDIETRSSRARNELMATIAAQFAGFGKTERATEIALENNDPNEKTSALSQIAQILTMQNEDDLARQTLNLIDEDADRVFALIAIADAEEKLDEKDAAIALLNEAASLSETVPQLASRSLALNEIAARFADQGDAAKAREISIKNLAVIGEIRDESSRAASLAGISTIYKNAELGINAEEKRILMQLATKA